MTKLELAMQIKAPGCQLGRPGSALASWPRRGQPQHFAATALQGPSSLTSSPKRCLLLEAQEPYVKKPSTREEATICSHLFLGSPGAASLHIDSSQEHEVQREGEAGDNGAVP